jgi:hypothetical protein
MRTTATDYSTGWTFDERSYHAVTATYVLNDLH